MLKKLEEIEDTNLIDDYAYFLYNMDTEEYSGPFTKLTLKVLLKDNRIDVIKPDNPYIPLFGHQLKKLYIRKYYKSPNCSSNVLINLE